MNISITPVPKAVAYKINKAFKLQDLSDEVNADIRAGWSPVGGIAIVEDKTITVFIQAMVLYSEKN